MINQVLRKVLLWAARNPWLGERLPALPFMQKAVHRCMPGEEIEDALGAAVDLQVLGIGANGHIGFNEPAAGLTARTHLVSLLQASREGNAVFFGGKVDDVPTEALSMGMGTILKARRLLLLATGPGKKDAIEAAVRGPVTTRIPASFLQLHPAVEILCDTDAAAGQR